MGLDQYLYARKYVSNWSFDTPQEKEEYAKVVESIGLTKDEIDPDNPAIYVSVPVLYWRKANQIHNWFVSEIQRGEDDCRDYFVTDKQLKVLLELCESVIEKKHPDVSEDLLPALGGAFYGTYDYGDWYYEQVERTAEMLKKILDNPKLMGYDFYYSSSW